MISLCRMAVPLTAIAKPMATMRNCLNSRKLTRNEWNSNFVPMLTLIVAAGLLFSNRDFCRWFFFFVSAFCFQRFFFFDDFSSVRWIAAISFSFNSRRNNLNWNANYEYGDDWIKQWMEQIWFVCSFLSSFWSSLILHAARKYFEKN